MAHKTFRECDGVRYVTKRLQSTTGLVRTISHAPKKRKAKTIKKANKIKDINKQLKVIDKLLKSHKHDSNNKGLSNICEHKTTAPSVYSYPVIDRRV